MTENSLSSEQIAAFDNDGFLIIRRFFAACEIAVIADCFDQVLADVLQLGRSYRHADFTSTSMSALKTVIAAHGRSGMVRRCHWAMRRRLCIISNYTKFPTHILSKLWLPKH